MHILQFLHRFARHSEYSGNSYGNSYDNMQTQVANRKAYRSDRGGKKMYISWYLPEEREMLRALAKERGQTMSRVEADLIRREHKRVFGRG